MAEGRVAEWANARAISKAVLAGSYSCLQVRVKRREGVRPVMVGPHLPERKHFGQGGREKAQTTKFGITFSILTSVWLFQLFPALLSALAVLFDMHSQSWRDIKQAM